jgi:hypothetical protein
MLQPILPDLTVVQHGHLRNEWSRHVEDALPVPSVDAPLATYEAEKLEIDFMRKVRSNPGPEVQRRLGVRVQPNYAAMNPSEARRSDQSREFDLGIRAVIRLLATGKNYGATDLQDVINGGAASPDLANVFDGAVKDLQLAQLRLCVRRHDRLSSAPEPSREPHLPGFDLGRSL